MRVGRDEQVVRAWIDGRAEQPPLGRVQVLGLVHQDVPVARRSRLAEQVGGLVGQLEVGGLAGCGELGRDPLGSLPDLAALGLGERASPAGAQAGQVGLLGVQVLGQDDLLPLVLQERRGEVEAGVGGGLRPASSQLSLVGDGRRAAGLLDHAVGQPVHVEHLDPAAHGGIVDQQVELGAERFGQVAVERGQQDGAREPGLFGAFGQEGRAVQHGHRLAGAGATGDLGRPGIAHAVGDLVLARMQERAPRGERVGQDQPQILLVPDLERPDARAAPNRQLAAKSFAFSCGKTVSRQYVSPLSGASTTPRQTPSIPIVRMRPSRLSGGVSRNGLGWVCLANSAIAISTALRVFLSSFAYSARNSFAMARRATGYILPWPAVPSWQPKGHAR